MSIYFSFKAQPSDFFVSEELAFEPSGQGDFLYLFFEKCQKNTMEILETLCKATGLKREDLGIAGLKDKEGITRQRLSIGKKKLNAAGGKDFVLDQLRKEVQLLKFSFHDEPLAVGKNKGNHFRIRLRKRASLPEQLKTELEARLEVSREAFFPNAFGIQRFGKGNKNYKKAEELFRTAKPGKMNYEVRFKLQAFGSMRFNELVMKRREEKAFLLEGDLMVNGWNAFGSSVAEYREGKLQHFDYWKLKQEKF